MGGLSDEDGRWVVVRRQYVAQVVHRIGGRILVDENQVDRSSTRLDHSVASRILHVPGTDGVIARLAERCSKQCAPPLIGHDDENSGSEGHGPMFSMTETRGSRTDTGAKVSVVHPAPETNGHIRY